MRKKSMLSTKQKLTIISSAVLVIAFLVCVVPFPVFVSNQLTGYVVSEDVQGRKYAGAEVEITLQGWRFVSLFRDESASISVTVSDGGLSGKLNGAVYYFTKPNMRYISGIYIDETGTARKLRLEENLKLHTYLLMQTLNTGDMRYYIASKNGTGVEEHLAWAFQSVR